MADTFIPEFEKWLTSIQPKLIRMAKSIIKDYSAAEDVVQETLIKVWEIYKTGSMKDITAYSQRAVWVNAIKYRARRRNLLSLDLDVLDKNGVPEPSVPADIDLELLPWELEEALSGLKPLQQAVIRMRYYSGLSFAEIGSNLDISMNTAASSTRYAIENLKRNLHKQPKE